MTKSETPAVGNFTAENAENTELDFLFEKQRRVGRPSRRSARNVQQASRLKFLGIIGRKFVAAPGDGRAPAAGMSTRPHNLGHPTAQTCHNQTEQRQAERFPGDLEMQQQKNPIHERHEQTSEEPPKTALVGDNQKLHLPVKTANQAGNKKHETDD
jgi:hypothetical protein